MATNMKRVINTQNASSPGHKCTLTSPMYPGVPSRFSNCCMGVDNDSLIDSCKVSFTFLLKVLLKEKTPNNHPTGCLINRLFIPSHATTDIKDNSTLIISSSLLLVINVIYLNYQHLVVNYRYRPINSPNPGGILFPIVRADTPSDGLL